MCVAYHDFGDKCVLTSASDRHLVGVNRIHEAGKLFHLWEKGYEEYKGTFLSENMTIFLQQKHEKNFSVET